MEDSPPDLLARDVYREWKRRVQKAQSNIRVFTPYLDLMLWRLLRNTRLGPEAVMVVTDLSPTSGATNYRGQLLGIRAILRDGIEVRTLDRLHAKVLQVDGATTVGSQNFTSYARASKETSAAFQVEHSTPNFLRTLEEWAIQARPVTEELVQALLDGLPTPLRAYTDARDALLQSYTTILAEHESDPILARTRRDKLRAEAAPLRGQVSRTVYGHRLKNPTAWTWTRLENQERDDLLSSYQTLKVWKGRSTLTSWPVRGPGGGWPLELERLRFYPLMLSPSGRMAYGRVAKSRITYIKYGIDYTERLQLGDRRVHLRVQCPQRDVDSGNLLLKCSTNIGAFDLRLRLGGQDCLVTEVTMNPAGWAKDLLHAYVSSLLEDDDALNSLVNKVLKPVHFQRVGINSPEATGFFPRGFLLARPIDIAGRTVLTFEER